MSVFWAAMPVVAGGWLAVALLALAYHLLLSAFLSNNKLMFLQLNTIENDDWTDILNRSGLYFYRNEWRFANESREASADIDCRAIWQSGNSLGSELGVGWSKSVHEMDISGRTFAIKFSNINGIAMQHCLRNLNRTTKQCQLIAIRKLLKELYLLKRLQYDPNIVRLHGYCISPETKMGRNPLKNLAIVTEVGRKLDVLNFVQITWQRRLALVRQLIGFFERTKNAFTVTDLRRQQFVLVVAENGHDKIVLVDLDDIVLVSDRQQHYTASSEMTTARRIYEQFIRSFLEFGLPFRAKAHFEQIHTNYENGTRLLLSDLHNWLRGFSSLGPW